MGKVGDRGYPKKKARRENHALILTLTLTLTLNFKTLTLKTLTREVPPLLIGWSFTPACGVGQGGARLPTSEGVARGFEAVPG